MFGRSRGLDVGWWMSVDDCDLHHPLHCARSCEVLIGGVLERGHPSPQSAAGTQHFSRFALMRARMPALLREAALHVLSQKSSHFRVVFVYAYAVKHERKNSQGPLIPPARSCESGLPTSQVQLLYSRNQTDVWFERAHHSPLD